jgi:hypothetical protein
MAAEYGARSVIHIPETQPNAFSLFIHSPAAFATTLFRPFLTDIKGNPLILISALENIFILVLLTGSLFRLQKPVTDRFILFCIFYLSFLFILIGLITPVLGALVRYRVPGLPVLMFLLVHYSDFSTILYRKITRKKELVSNS